MAHIFVRGFDNGTSLEEVVAHMSTVGTVINGEMHNKGSAVLTYSSANEALAAISTLSGTTIDGNTRYIDVLSRKDGPGEGGAKMAAGGGSGCHVFVRGFDHGTSYEQVICHMSRVGTIINGQLLDKGSAVLTYSTQAEAEQAIQQMTQSIIAGNTRYIDVMARTDGPDPVRSMLGGGNQQSQGVKRSAAAPGCHVFVRGFDHGTSYEDVVAHMSNVGTVVDGELLQKGSAVISYSSPDEAVAAVEMCSGTIIPGNTRYIDVMPRVDGPGAKKAKQPAMKAGGEAGGGNNAMMMQMMKMMQTLIGNSGNAVPKGKAAPKKKK